jgi:Zn-dependent protease with chaperone function
MLFSNLIFFVLALLIYSSYTSQEPGDVRYFLFSFISLIIGWYLATWFAFRHHKKKIEQSPFEAFRVMPLLNALEARFIISALFLYFYLVYGTGFKNIIQGFSFVRASSFLDIAIGIAPFFILLIILWFNSFILFQTSSSVSLTRKKYLISHLRLNIPILLPVFLFSLFQDLLRIIPFTKNLGASESFSFLDLVWFLPFMILLMIFYPFFLRLFWSGHPMPRGGRREKFEAFCRKAGLKVSEILIWTSFPGRIITAGITGLIAKFRYLFITPELLDLLNDEEMEAVIAHEAGHVKKRHMVYYGLLFLGFPLFFSLFSSFLGLAVYGFADYIDPYITKFTNNPTLFSLSALMFFALGIVMYFRLFFGVLSRNFERQADLFVFEIKGHPFALISSLEKISRVGGHVKDQPNWHHFSISQRIKFLVDCVEDQRCRDLHDKKVGRIKGTLIALICVSLLLLGAINLPPIKNTVELKFLEKQVQRIMAKNPHHVELPLALADFLFAKKNYCRAEHLYRLIIQNNPDNATALNNLAWLYATADNLSLRDNKKALALAQKAASLTREPHILDTLAEAYFINGNTKEALKAIGEAIALKPADLSYYYKQKQKFLGKNESHQE